MFSAFAYGRARVIGELEKENADDAEEEHEENQTNAEDQGVIARSM